MGCKQYQISSFNHIRKQIVSVNDFNSDISRVTRGTPQGSALGSLLFLIYINDVNRVIKH